jgi:hypothetical protein
MQLTRREIRQLPLHDLVDRLEATYLLWRFEDRHSALEGSLAVELDRLIHEVRRRRTKRLATGCTCQICWDFARAFDQSELL